MQRGKLEKRTKALADKALVYLKEKREPLLTRRYK